MHKGFGTTLRAMLGAGVAAILVAACGGGGGNGGSGSDVGATPPPSTGATLYAFGGTTSPMQDGAEPKGTLTSVVLANGEVALFGRTAIGGSNGCGTIFSIRNDGTAYNVQYRFQGPDGCDPRHDAMVLSPYDGRLYSTTQGINQTIAKPPPPNTYGNWGQILSFVPGTSIASPINAVHTFANPSPTAAPFDGAEQHSSFSFDPFNFKLYGQSAAGGAKNEGMLYSVMPDGTGFTDLFDFANDEGTDPHGRTVYLEGILYGITRSNGLLSTDAEGKKSYGFGTVYAYTLDNPPTNHKPAVLHVFSGAPDDGAFSDHGYVTPVAVNGKTLLFGMTQCGGSGPKNSACKGNGDGSGVIFQIDPTATPGSPAAFNVVYSFQATSSTDGALPYGSLMYDGTNLYGTTSAGGQYGHGTVFQTTPVPMGAKGTITLLYQFGAYANDGIKPIDNVIRLKNMLYGMTVYGGAPGPSPDDPSVNGNGTIFGVQIPN